MRYFLSFFGFLLLFEAVAQQRVGFELSTNAFRLNTTLYIQKVLKNKVLISGGIFFGGHGFGGFLSDSMDRVAHVAAHSPFPKDMNVMQYAGYEFRLSSYSLRKNNALGLQLGLGFFYEVNVKHGLRFNLNTKVGYSNAHILYTYYQRDAIQNVIQKYTTRPLLFVGISPELVHTIRATGRITFYYGVKVPYFTSLTKKMYNPIYTSDAFKGFEPELNIGFTRVFGKCN
jgi:hypothetical protein